MKKRIYFFSFLFLIIGIQACQDESVSQQSSENNTQSSGAKELDAINAKIAKEPSNVELQMDKVQLLLENEMFDQAAHEMKNVREQDSSSMRYLILQAEIYLNTNESRKALEIADELVAVYPLEREAIMEAAEIEIILKRYTSAQIHLNMILELNPRDEEAYFLKGLAYRYADDVYSAADAFQQVVQIDPSRSDAYIELGNIFTNLHNPLAIQYFNNALRVDPSQKEAVLGLANYYWFDNQYELAKSNLHRMMEMDSTDFRPYFNEGLIMLEQDSAMQAIPLFDHVLNEQPNYPGALFYKGIAQENSGDKDAALVTFKTLKKVSPNYPELDQHIFVLENN